MAKMTWALAAVSACGMLTGCDQTPDAGMQPARMGDGGFVLYETSGNRDGEPVLMIHGGRVAASFLPIMDEPALSDYYLIRYHRRGYGGSSNTDVGGIGREADDAASLLEHLGVERAHIVGHSAGGPIAMELARTKPDLVHSVVSLEGAAGVRMSGAARRAGITVEEYPAWFDQELDEMKRRAAERSIIGEDDIPWMSRGLIPGAIEQANADRANDWLSSQVAREAVPDGYYDDIRQPILYVLGANPPGYAENVSRMLGAYVPTVEVRTLSDAANHSFQVDFPQPTAEAIAEWLADHPF